MSTKTDHADTVLAPLLGRLGDDPTTDFVDAIVTRVREALRAGPKGSLRAWMQAHDGQLVTTLQVSNGAGTVWCPTGRTIDASRAGGVVLSGSTRPYRGMVVAGATDAAIVVADDWHTVAYVIEPSH